MNEIRRVDSHRSRCVKGGPFATWSGKTGISNALISQIEPGHVKDCACGLGYKCMDADCPNEKPDPLSVITDQSREGERER